MEMGNPQNQPRSHRGSRGKKKGIKVTYISSPMKVKASSAEFRAIVQELTGCNSNPESMDAWSAVNNVDDAAHSTSAINPISSTPMLDQGFIWREASDGFPGFQFPCVFA